MDQSQPADPPEFGLLGNLTPNVAFPGPNDRQMESRMKDAVIEAVFGDGDVEQVLKAAQDMGQSKMP